MAAPARDADVRHMRRCLALARRAEGRTSPNPIVGCVIVDRRGEVIAEGWHRRLGAPHAEADALATLGGKARGATLYVSLEPCAHHGRTPPCAPAVVAAGVRRVVIGAMDPIAGHAGGARLLRRAGIDVTTGVLEDACVAANRPFFTWARLGRPHVVLKAGISLDGRVATHTGESRWITGDDARADVHRLRDRLDAVLVGVGTLLADDPQLTVRGVRGGRDPVRVVLDSGLRTPPGARALVGAGTTARVIVATVEGAPRARARRLEQAGAEVWRVGAAGGRVDVAALARRLAVEGVASVLVEGGPEVHASFVAADLADEVRLYVAPVILGGHGRHGGPAWVGGVGADLLANAPRLVVDGAPRRVGDDVLIVARRARPAW